MATSTVQGVNFEVDGNTINFFGAKGKKSDDGQWYINPFGGEVWAQVSPDSIMPRVRGCIEDDIANGKGEQIALLKLGARQAVVLYLEGVLTRDHLRGAVEGAYNIEVPNVDIDGRVLTVHIEANPAINVATADVHGIIL